VHKSPQDVVVDEHRIAHATPAGTRLIQSIAPPAVRHEYPGCVCNLVQALAHLGVLYPNEEAVPAVEIAVCETLSTAYYCTAGIVLAAAARPLRHADRNAAITAFEFAREIGVFNALRAGVIRPAASSI
jgi:hypothetical protein